MTLSATALAAILSLTTLPFALQVEIGPQNGESVSPVEVQTPDGAVDESAPDISRDMVKIDQSANLPPLGLPVETVEDSGSEQPVSSDEADTERNQLIADISASLRSVATAQGRFIQTAPDSSQSEGMFYLRRPGRVRFEYDDPVPILIVADGATVAIEDRDLETQDRVPLRSTPLGLLLDDDLDFETEAEILNVRRANGLVAIALSDRTGETEGVLELFFEEGTYDLRGWYAEDAAGGATSVQLQDVETGMRINPRLFRIEDLEEDEGRD